MYGRPRTRDYLAIALIGGMMFGGILAILLDAVLG